MESAKSTQMRAVSYTEGNGRDEAYSVDERRRISSGRAAGAGGGAGRFRDGEYCGAKPGAEWDSAIADAAAADRLQQNRGAGVGHRWDGGGLRDRGAAQTFAGKTGHRDFRNQSRGKSRRKYLLLRNCGSGAGRGATSHSVGGDVVVLEKDGSEIRKLGACGAGRCGNDF